MSIHRNSASEHHSTLITCKFAEHDGQVEVIPAPVKTFARMKEKVAKRDNNSLYCRIIVANRSAAHYKQIEAM